MEMVLQVATELAELTSVAAFSKAKHFLGRIWEENEQLIVIWVVDAELAFLEVGMVEGVAALFFLVLADFENSLDDKNIFYCC